MSPPKKTSAFALVEVVLALGVVSFALTAVFGLLAVACSTGKASLDDTTLVAMTNRAISDLRAPGFTTLLQTANIAPPATSAPVQLSAVFFDSDGQWLPAAGTATPQGAIYRCSRSVQVDAGTLSAVGGSVHLLHATLQFAWPAQAANPPNTRTVDVDIASY